MTARERHGKEHQTAREEEYGRSNGKLHALAWPQATTTQEATDGSPCDFDWVETCVHLQPSDQIARPSWWNGERRLCTDLLQAVPAALQEQSRATGIMHVCLPDCHVCTGPIALAKTWLIRESQSADKALDKTLERATYASCADRSGYTGGLHHMSLWLPPITDHTLNSNMQEQVNSRIMRLLTSTSPQQLV